VSLERVETPGIFEPNSRDLPVASRSNHNIIATLALCESCALSVRNSNGTAQPRDSSTLSDILDRVEQTAREARKQWPSELTKKEADKIAERMKKIDVTNHLLDSSHPECTLYYTSLSLGLLDQLLWQIQDMRRVEQLERVEHAIWDLHLYFDRDLDRFATYEHASRAISLWFECLYG
jgi:hypothetical protein